MMRLRRASAISVLSLLAWAATASAECAWVFWLEAGDARTHESSGSLADRDQSSRRLHVRRRLGGCVMHLHKIAVPVPTDGYVHSRNNSGGKLTSAARSAPGPCALRRGQQ